MLFFVTCPILDTSLNIGSKLSPDDQDALVCLLCNPSSPSTPSILYAVCMILSVSLN